MSQDYAVLSVDRGSFCYRDYEENRTNVFTDVSFEIRDGELVSVLGPNGAGKTTLLRCTMGFLPWKSGCSMLNGRDIRQYSPRELFRKIAYVPQAKMKVPAYTVREMVLLGRSSHLGMFEKPGKADFEAADAVIEELGLSDKRHRRCSEISGGELQMVLIARAMCSNPSVLILDEPESNLDFRNQLVVMETLVRLKNKGVACLFNTHFPAHALQYSDHALLMCRNGVPLYGRTEDVIKRDNIEHAFGVKAVIGTFSCEGCNVRDVVPLGII